MKGYKELRLWKFWYKSDLDVMHTLGFKMCKLPYRTNEYKELLKLLNHDNENTIEIGYVDVS
jgi:hypothetical protein